MRDDNNDKQKHETRKNYSSDDAGHTFPVVPSTTAYAYAFAISNIIKAI